MALTQKFYRDKRKELGDKLAKDSLALIYSGREIPMSADANYPFYTNNNFNYLTGINEAEVVLVLAKNKDGELLESLYLLEIDPLKEKWQGRKLRPDEAKSLSGISDIREKKAFIGDFTKANFTNLYWDRQVPAHQQQESDDEAFKKRWQEAVGHDLSPFFQAMRVIKTGEEIAAIKKAVSLTKEAFAKVKQKVKPDVLEYELAACFEYYIKIKGASGLAFETIVASGENATILHYTKNSKKLRAGELVLFDLGARLNNYCGDISRTLAVSGQMTKVQALFYEMVERVQAEMIKAYRPGASLKALQAQTTALFESHCRRLGLLPKSGDIRDYYYHGIGHSLGMDTHDIRPKGDLILRPGMVLSVEPGIYVKDHGLGIRIEDDVVITEEGCQVL